MIKLDGWKDVSDVWSLGCTIIELLQGAPPYFEYVAQTCVSSCGASVCLPASMAYCDACKRLPILARRKCASKCLPCLTVCAYSLYPMAAMYKIVEEAMPVPDEGLSQELKDFLHAVRPRTPRQHRNTDYTDEKQIHRHAHRHHRSIFVTCLTWRASASPSPPRVVRRRAACSATRG